MQHALKQLDYHHFWWLPPNCVISKKIPPKKNGELTFMAGKHPVFSTKITTCNLLASPTDQVEVKPQRAAPETLGKKTRCQNVTYCGSTFKKRTKGPVTWYVGLGGWAMYRKLQVQYIHPLSSLTWHEGRSPTEPIENTDILNWWKFSWSC